MADLLQVDIRLDVLVCDHLGILIETRWLALQLGNILLHHFLNERMARKLFDRNSLLFVNSQTFTNQILNVF